MSPSRINCYHLPVEAIADLTTQAIGKLHPALAPRADTMPFSVLDGFSQPLSDAGCLLLASPVMLELISSGGEVISQPSTSQPQFIAEFPDSPIKQALAFVSPLRRLLTVGSGQMQQAVLSCVDDEGKTHCRADIIYLDTANQGAAALIVLHGIRGYEGSLELLRERIAGLGAVAFDGSALYSRLFPDWPAYSARPAIQIDGSATAFDAAHHIISAHFPLVRANEPGIAADYDTEFLHDYRIHLRKIRSVLSLFKGIYDDTLSQALKTRFAALMAPTGRLRDLDVYLLEKQACYDLLPDSLHQGLDTLYRMFAEQRQIEQLSLAKHLRSKAYRQDISDLEKVFQTPQHLQRGPCAELPAHDYACSLIWKRYRKVCKMGANMDADTPDARIHALRIHCKKLRYLIEFFGPIFPQQALSEVLRHLRRLQNNLGRFNDYSVQQHSLQAAMQQYSATQGSSGLEIAQSVGALIAVLHRRQLQERAKVARNAAKFNHPATQQIFRTLFNASKARP